MQAIAPIDPLQLIIDELRAMLPEMSCMADALEDMDNIGYFRVVDRKECVDAANKEAHEHGSILAYKGEVTVIMPKLISGWTEYGRAV